MSRDSERTAEVREWLEKVAIDLRAARLDLAAAPPLLEDALFHCQQAVEKAFKAFLASREQLFRRTHSIEELGRMCSHLDAMFESLTDEAAPLTEYAWAYRYPGITPAPTQSEANSAMTIATRVVRAVVERVPEGAVPPGLP